MKAPYSWLTELVPGLPAPDACAEALIRLGHEVEEIERPRESLAGVRIGQILRIEPHPNADRLRLLTVSIGPGEPLAIVCGATNMREGDKVPVATVGASLPNGLTIRRSRIRGVESCGMCCSPAELGLEGDASGLWILPADAPVGMALADWLGMEEAVLVLSITPNRGDCMSIRGLARELAADFDRPLAPLPSPAPWPSGGHAPRVRIEDDGCPFYAAVRIEGVTIGNAPAKVRQRLAAAGMRSVNGVVDLLNYLMIELGQPMHAFDADAIEGDLIVRAARGGEALDALDGRRYALDAGDLVIADEGGRVHALAGIIGAAASEVQPATRSLILESAFFAPARISLARRRLGIVSEACLRFERGVDPALVEHALARAAAWIVELFGGRIVGVGRAGAIEPLTRPRTIHAEAHRIADRLGFAPPAWVDETLGRMGIEVRREGDALVAVVPPFRRDLEAWWDLSEEYGRIAGLEAVPSVPPRLPAHRPPAAGVDWTAPAIEAGCVEVVQLAFSSPARERAFTAEDGADVRLANPLGEDASILRRSLLPGLAEATARNLRRGLRSVRLVERGRVYHWADGAPAEEERIAFAIGGLAHDDEWFAKARTADFFDLKGIVEHWLARHGLSARFEADDALPGLQPGQAARIRVGKQAAGVIGRIDDGIAARLAADAPIFVAELRLTALPARRPTRLAAAPEHPAIVRDLVFLAPRTLAATDLVRAVRRAAGASVEDVRVFDRYAGAGLPEGMISLGVRITLRAADRTLTQDDAEAACRRAIAAAEALGCRLRGTDAPDA